MLFVVQGAKWIKCRALFALDKMGVARGGDIAVRVGLTEQVSTIEREEREETVLTFQLFLLFKEMGVKIDFFALDR